MQASHNLPDRYTIKSVLGKGGFGVVYKALDCELNREVAIKVLSNVSIASKSSLKKEFETLSKLSHPHLVRVYSYGFITEDIPFFTMEYFEGDDLRTFFSKSQAIKQLPAIIDQVLQALSHLHKKQIIHSDIKPDNIFIKRDGNDTISTKLLDFGLVSTIQEKNEQTSGTPRFIAPEVLSKRECSPASDLYSFGMTLIESLSGRNVPNALDIDQAFLNQIQKEISNLLSSYDIPNPSAIASFIENLASLDSADRPQNALEASRRFKVIHDVSSHDIFGEIDNVFIGREHEIAVIEEFLTKNKSDKRILILEGPRGIGKKRLTQKAISMAQPEGYFVIDLSSESFARNTLEQILNTISSNLTPSKRNKFLSRHNKILDLVKTHTEEKKRSIDNTRVAYSNMVASLQEIASHTPTLICIPDIERFSEDFIFFIDQLIHELRFRLNTDIRLIISFSSDLPRNKILSQFMDKCAAYQYAQRLLIPPFRLKQLEELQYSLFDGRLFNKQQIERIITDTDGIPLLIIEFIKHLIINNVIKYESGLWHLDKSTYYAIPIPGSITQYLQEQYSKLSRAQKDILHVMACWERPISYEILATLLNKRIFNIDTNVNSLIDSMLIEYTSSELFHFSHAACSIFIKSKISKIKSQKISDLIVQYLENSSTTDYERIAHHAIAAKKASEAYTYGLQAANILEHHLEYHKCYELLTKLKTLILKTGNVDQIIGVLERVAPIELQIGFREDALATYKQLLNYALDDNKNAFYSRAIGRIYASYLGDKSAARQYFNNALAFAKKGNDKHILAETILDITNIGVKNEPNRLIYAASLVKDIDSNLYAKIISFLVMAYVDSGNYSEAHKHKSALRNMISNVEPTTKAFIYSGLFALSFYSGNYEEATLWAENSVKNDKEYYASHSSSSLNALGGIYYIQGDFYSQIRVLKENFNEIVKYNLYNASFCLSNLSLAHMSVADYREAYKALELAASFYDYLKGKYANEWALSKYIHFYALLGDAEKENYRRYLKRTISIAKRNANSIILGHTKLINGIYNYQRLQSSKTILNINAAIKIFRNANDRDDIVDGLTLKTMILIEKGDLKEASKAVTEAREIFDAIHCNYLKPQLLLAEGALARAQQSDTALARLKEALKISKKMFTREYTWQIQRELALYHKDRGELHKALQYYRDAIDMIKEITETIDGEELKTSYLSLPFRKRVFDEIKVLKKQLN